MVYNLTNLWMANNTVQMIGEVNTISNDHLIGFLMFAIYMFIIIKYQYANFRTTLFAASFIMTILGVLFYTLGWVGLPILIIPILLTFVGIFIVLFVD